MRSYLGIRAGPETSGVQGLLYLINWHDRFGFIHLSIARILPATMCHPEQAGHGNDEGVELLLW